MHADNNILEYSNRGLGIREKLLFYMSGKVTNSSLPILPISWFQCAGESGFLVLVLVVCIHVLFAGPPSGHWHW